MPGIDFQRIVPIFKAHEGEDVHSVLAPVLIPEKEDLQGDIVSAAEIEKTAWDFMMWSRTARVQHVAAEVHGLDMVESFLAPVKFKVGPEMVPMGTWLMKMLITDPMIWKLVESGELTGLSMKGEAQTDESPSRFPDEILSKAAGTEVAKARRLHNIRTWEVSLVDRPAVKTPFLVVKRDAAQAGSPRDPSASENPWEALAKHLVGRYIQQKIETENRKRVA